MRSFLAAIAWLAVMSTACSSASSDAEHDAQADSDGAHDAQADSDGAHDAQADSGHAEACEHNAASGDQCPDAAKGWLAIKTTLDVWWPGTPVRDPGRGDVDVFALAKLGSVCGDELAPTGQLKLCGLNLPIATSEIGCEAYALSADDEIWDRPAMPRVHVEAHASALNPGSELRFARATGLFGIDLRDDALLGEWPSAESTHDIECEAGRDSLCFPDQDGDDLPGITLTVRNDGAAYESPAFGSQCASGQSYAYRGLPAAVDVAAGPNGDLVHALQVQVGLRAGFGGIAMIDANCVHGHGQSLATTFDLRAFDCAIDPVSLSPAPNPPARPANNACLPSEALFVDENLPAYRVLQADEEPGPSMRPLGWEMIDRDISSVPSGGPKLAFVRLASLDEPEPSCESVRSARY